MMERLSLRFRVYAGKFISMDKYPGLSYQEFENAFFYVKLDLLPADVFYTMYM